MMTLIALALALTLNADPATLQLQQPTLQVDRPTATLGVPSLASHSGVSLATEGQRAAATVSLAVLCGLGGAFVVGVVALTAVAAALVVLGYLAIEAVVAALKVGSAIGMLDTEPGRPLEPAVSHPPLLPTSAGLEARAVRLA